MSVKAELLDHMGDDLAVANAARVSFHKESDWGVEQTYLGHGDMTDPEPVLKDTDAKLICYLARHHHWTPFAHTCAKFRIKAPIFLARQFFKHKVGLVENEVSRRYVDDEPEFFTPDSWRRRPDNVKQGSDPSSLVWEMEDHFKRTWSITTVYQDHLNACVDLYDRMLDAGVCPEQARMVLPQSMMTEWIWTGSVASFARVVNQRVDSHAQLEAQQLAKLIGDEMRDLFPVSWSALVDARS